MIKEQDNVSAKMVCRIGVFDSIFRFFFFSRMSLSVCALHVDSANDKLVSGSWDNNAIVWSISDSANFMV